MCTILYYSSTRLILLYTTCWVYHTPCTLQKDWVYHILCTLDVLGLPHTLYTRRAGSTTYLVHQTCWVYHIPCKLDVLGLPHTLYTRRTGSTTYLVLYTRRAGSTAYLVHQADWYKQTLNHQAILLMVWIKLLLNLCVKHCTMNVQCTISIWMENNTHDNFYNL